MSTPGGRPDDVSGHASETACHATCLLLGEDGVLLRGPAGAGKSTLCLECLDRADAVGGHARLVGDDRVRLSRRNGRIIARPHPALEGLIEIRGLGIRRLASSARAVVVRLVVDLVEARARMPDEPETATLLTVALPLLVLARDRPREYLVRQALSALCAGRSGPGPLDGSVAWRTQFAANGMIEPAAP